MWSTLFCAITSLGVDEFVNREGLSIAFLGFLVACAAGWREEQLSERIGRANRTGWALLVGALCGALFSVRNGFELCSADIVVTVLRVVVCMAGAYLGYKTAEKNPDEEVGVR